MSLFNNFNQPQSSPRDRRSYYDESGDYELMKDFFNFSRFGSLFNQISFFDDFEKKHRQLFNDPFCTGVLLTDDQQRSNQQRIEHSAHPTTAGGDKENPQITQQSSSDNQQQSNDKTMTVSGQHNNNRPQPHHHSNSWLTNPFGSLSRLSRHTNHLIPSQISIDITELPNEYNITAALPGVEKENIKVECNSDRRGHSYLTISAEQKNEVKQEDKERKYVYSETSFGSVQRTIPLPKDVDMEKGVSAKLENGQLKLNVPRNEQKKQTPKQITIQ